MKRGEVWIVAGGADYTGKPRPAIIVQSSEIMDVDSVVVCPFTSATTTGGRIRPLFQPTPENGLRSPCSLMIDKISALPKSKLGQRVGETTPVDMARVDEALMIFLGLAG